MWGRRFPIAFHTPRKLLDLLAAIKNNQFAICDEEKSTTELGSAIYLNASLLNHSCAPNAVPLFSGLKLYVKALKKIEPGDEITIAYCDTSTVTENRQSSLREIYRFKCSCEHCVGPCAKKLNDRKLESTDGTPLSDSDHLIQSALTTLGTLDEFKKQKEWKLIGDTTKGWLNRKMLPEHNIFSVRISEHALDAAIENKEWDAAISACGALIPAYKEYFGSNHPTLGLLLMKFGKILSWIERYEDCETYFKSAFGILSLYYPPESSIRKQLHDLVIESYEKNPPKPSH